MRWKRQAADNGLADSCLTLAADMYSDQMYARGVGNLGEAAGVDTSAGVMEGHDVPPEVLTSVLYWLRKGGHNPVHKLEVFRRSVFQKGNYCCNEGCQVLGLLNDFKVCPQCKTARYCSDACQKHDWTAGGHKATCGTCDSRGKRRAY